MSQKLPEISKINTLRDLRAAAVSYHQAGELETAIPLYRRYVANAPKDALMWSNLGALFRSQKNYTIAALCQRRALSLDSETLIILNNAANAIYDDGDPKTALNLREKACVLAPEDPNHWSSLAKYQRALRQHETAKQTMEKALTRFPEDAECHIQLSFALLSLGDYPNGFEAFDWRWQGDEISLPEFKFPRWQGENLKGKTLLITPEQGFGDTVLMARFLKPLQKTGAIIKFIVKPPLQRLFKNTPGIDTILPPKPPIPSCDYWTPMMDLPRYLGTTLDTIPPPTELSIPKDSTDRAHAILAPFKDSFNIGVLWSGSLTYRANHKRSFSHQQFLQLANIPAVQMFSLYKGPLQKEIQNDGTSCLIIDTAGSERDFADSAALIQELDLVITMDSAIAHIAGSLGAPVWNLLHSEPYWLYEPFENHTPWYPSMRLIRQEIPGDWDNVFSQLHQEISKMAQTK